MADVELKADPDGDVVYAKRRAARIDMSREAEHDSSVIFDLDVSGHIVGVQVLVPHEVHWMDHPDRRAVPDDIRAALDGWFQGATP